MKRKKVLIIQLIVLATSLILIILSAWNVRQNISKYQGLKSESKVASQRVESIKKDYLKSQKQLEEKINLQVNSDNELVREIANHNNNYSIMTSLSTEFFKVYFTWTDINSYQNRPNELKNIISDSLFNNKSIFDDGKDNTGGDYIKALGLKSDFESSEVSVIDDESAIVKVQYEGGQDSKDAKSTSTRFYLVNYDISNQKIENIKAIFSKNIAS